MSKVRIQIAMSLDGFVAGLDQSVEDPLGKGGMRLHEWVFALAAWRSQHGMEGGIVTESTPIVEAALQGLGATIMGRNMFGGGRGPWDTKTPWDGWWGPNPPYHNPVFVLTHHARASVPMEGGTTFHFVTEGLPAAFEQARRVAGGLDIAIAGGASTVRQALAADLVDQLTIHLAPILLGRGERIFDGGVDDLHGLTLVRTVAAPNVTHLTLARK